MEDRDYQCPCRLAAKLRQLTIKITPPKLTPADEQKLKEAEAQASDNR